MAASVGLLCVDVGWLIRVVARDDCGGAIHARAGGVGEGEVCRVGLGEIALASHG